MKEPARQVVNSAKKTSLFWPAIAVGGIFTTAALLYKRAFATAAPSESPQKKKEETGSAAAVAPPISYTKIAIVLVGTVAAIAFYRRRPGETVTFGQEGLVAAGSTASTATIRDVATRRGDITANATHITIQRVKTGAGNITVGSAPGP